MVAVLLLTLVAGCATEFRGSAHISPAECSRRCGEIGGRLAAYVFVGAYSSACVCEPRGARASSSGGSASGGATAAAAGVSMQMARNAEQQRGR